MLKKLQAYQKARLVKRRLRRVQLEKRRSARRFAKRTGRTIQHVYAWHHQIPYDPHARRHQIVLPSVFSLAENYEDTVAKINEIYEFAVVQRKPVMLHFNHVRQIEPAATLVLVSEIFRARHLRSPRFVTGTYPSDQNVYRGLKEMGFYRLLNVQDMEGVPSLPLEPGRPVFLQFVSENRVIPEFADGFVGLIEKHLFEMNELARSRLVVAIKEAMSNTLDHAHPQSDQGNTMRNRWWLSSWVNLIDREVTVVFYDQGVGIPSTLDALSFEKIAAAFYNLFKLKFDTQPSDSQMIAAATEYHRSGKGDGRGRGFTDMKRFIDICCDGELRVLSNRGKYHYMKGQQEIPADALSSLGGTVVEWRFRNDGALEMVDD